MHGFFRGIFLFVGWEMRMGVIVFREECPALI